MANQDVCRRDKTWRMGQEQGWIPGHRIGGRMNRTVVRVVRKMSVAVEEEGMVKDTDVSLRSCSCDAIVITLVATEANRAALHNSGSRFSSWAWQWNQGGEY